MATNNSDNNTVTKEQTTFEKLQLLLQFLDIDTLLLPVKDENPVEQLMVSSGNDDDDKGFMLQMMFINDLLQSTNIEEFKEKEDDTFYLQFYSVYPVNVPTEKLLDFYKLLSAFNKVLPVGAYDLNNDGLAFRYCFLSKGRELEQKMVVEVIGMIQFYLKVTGMRIVEFVQTDKTMEEAILDVENELGKSIRPNS